MPHEAEILPAYPPNWGSPDPKSAPRASFCAIWTHFVKNGAAQRSHPSYSACHALRSERNPKTANRWMRKRCVCSFRASSKPSPASPKEIPVNLDHRVQVAAMARTAATVKMAVMAAPDLKGPKGRPLLRRSSIPSPRSIPAKTQPSASVSMVATSTSASTFRVAVMARLAAMAHRGRSASSR